MSTKEQWYKKEKSWSFKLYRNKDDRFNKDLVYKVLIANVFSLQSFFTCVGNVSDV